MLEKAQSSNIQHWIEAIDEYNATPNEGTTRAVYTKEDMLGRNYVVAEMQKLGLKVQVDCLGNIYGELPGKEPELPGVWTGSHIDTVPNGGKYDGLAGVFAGMEALRIIKASGIKNKRTLSVNVYAGEEMSRFGMCCIGSRALVGRTKADDLHNYKSPEGESLYQAIKKVGLAPERFAEEFPSKKSIYAHLELHIEQNDILEKAKLPIGIVKGICAPTNMLIEVWGQQTHAGGTSMAARKDAFMAAAEMSLALENLAKTSTSQYITGTVGHVEIDPNAANVIPGHVKFSVDVRSISASDKEELYQAFQKEVAAIAVKRGVKVKTTLLNHDVPVLCEEGLRKLLAEQAQALNIPYMDIVSGPYHDSLILGDITRVGMLFVPCKDGISHDRAEWASYEDIAQGADILASAMLTLANE